MQTSELQCMGNREFHGLGRPARGLGNATTPSSHLITSKSTRIHPFPFVAHVNLRHGDDDLRHHGRWLHAGQNSGCASSARYQYMPEAEELIEVWSAWDQRAAQGCWCFVHLRCSRDVRYSCGCCWINVCVAMPLQAVWASDAKRLCLFLPLATVEPGCSLLAQGHPSLQNSWIRILHVPLARTVCSGKPVIACTCCSRLIARSITIASAPAATHGAQGPVNQCCCCLRNHGLRLENPAILAREDSPRPEAR